MASTVKNFLVGIGYDYDKKGEKQVGSGIDSIKSKALQLGTVVAGAFGIKKLTSDFADAKDKLGLFSDVFGSSIENIKSLGEAATSEGSSLSDTLGTLQSIEQTRAAIKTGGVGIFGEAGKAMGDATAVVQAKNSFEAMMVIADQLKGLDLQGRLNLGKAWGLDPNQIRFYSQGSDKVREMVAEQKEMNTVTREQTDAARAYNKELHTFGQNAEGISNKISERLLPALTGVVSDMNSWIKVNREMINSGVDVTLDTIADNAGLIAGAFGILAASSAFGVLFKFGRLLPIFGGLATAIGAIGLSLAAWAAAAFVAWQIGKEIGNVVNDNLTSGQEDFIGKGLVNTAALFGNKNAQKNVAMRKNTALENERFNKQKLFATASPDDIPTIPLSQRTPNGIPTTVAGDIPVIEVRNVVEIDGNVISDVVNKELGKEVERTMNDIVSTTER